MDKTCVSSDKSVKGYIASLDEEQTLEDTEVLIAIMMRISGNEPKMWHEGTIGFDCYHYKYQTKREGDNFIIGFYPRKGKITCYLMDGTARYAEIITKLGKCSTTGYCIYLKRLSDIDLPVLEHIIHQSYKNIKSKSLAGPIDRILWQTEK